MRKTGCFISENRQPIQAGLSAWNKASIGKTKQDTKNTPCLWRILNEGLMPPSYSPVGTPRLFASSGLRKRRPSPPRPCNKSAAGSLKYRLPAISRRGICALFSAEAAAPERGVQRDFREPLVAAQNDQRARLIPAGRHFNVL